MSATANAIPGGDSTEGVSVARAACQAERANYVGLFEALGRRSRQRSVGGHAQFVLEELVAFGLLAS